MQTSKLDAKLQDVLRPLVEMGALMRVPPFVNTLSLGLHYTLAHPNAQAPDDRVDLDDWNRFGKSSRHLDGVFIFYSTKDVADRLEALTSEPGIFSSVPVTRFRQRFVFVRRNPVSEALASAAHGQLASDFFDEAAARGVSVTIYSDIIAQAQALIAATSKSTAKPLVIGSGHWSVPRTDDDSEMPLFVYSGPCVTYMARASSVFVPLEVNDETIADAPQYETRVIWHVPEGSSDLIGPIRRAISAYHQILFEAASTPNDADFGAMSASCKETLAARHPSFAAEIFAEPKSFRTCLLDHHANPVF